MVSCGAIARRGCPPTACPGNALYAQLPDLRRRAEAVAPAVASTAVQLESAGPGVDALRYGEALTLSGVVRRALRARHTVATGQPWMKAHCHR